MRITSLRLLAVVIITSATLTLVTTGRIPRVEADGTVPLQQYFSTSTADNVATATQAGINSARSAGYVFIRTEGYISPTNVSGTVPLQQFYSAGRRDNFVTATQDGVNSAYAAGYVLTRTEGYIYSSQVPGTVPLQQYFSTSRSENFATATQDGINSAYAAGYIFIRTEGYIFPTPTSGSNSGSSVAHTQAGCTPGTHSSTGITLTATVCLPDNVTSSPNYRNGTILHYNNGSDDFYYVVYNQVAWQIPDIDTLNIIEIGGTSVGVDINSDGVAALDIGGQLKSINDLRAQPDWSDPIIDESSAMVRPHIKLMFRPPAGWPSSDIALRYAEALSTEEDIISGIGCIVPSVGVAVAAVVTTGPVGAVILTGIEIEANPFCLSFAVSMLERAAGVQGTSLADQ